MTKYIQIFKSQFKLISLAIGSGILIGTSYIPFPAWAIWFCYIPLWHSVLKAQEQNLSLKFIFLLGWLTQFTLTLIGFNWLYFTAREFGELPIVISALTLLLFAALMHVYIPLALVVAVGLKRKYNFSISTLLWVICCCHVFAERLWPSIFEWNLAYTLLWMKWPIYQWADTFGFWGLSALIFLVNAGLYYALSLCQTKRKACFSIVILIVFAIGFLNFTGSLRQKTWEKTDSEVNFAIIQASISNDAKVAAEKGLQFQNFVIDKYFKTTEKTLTEFKTTNPSTIIDFIVYPETALPFPLDQHYHLRMNQQALLSRLSFWNTSLVTGGYSLDPNKKDFHGNNIVRNSLFYMNPKGLVSPPYFKTHLLVFGEYMPLGEQFPFLFKLLPFVGTYERGPGAITADFTTLTGKQISFGAQICYESLDPHFSRKLANDGTQIIVNVTNDSWFGAWAEPYQHMIMTMARGIENRRPLIRSTNTGISTAIQADGTLLSLSPIDQVWGQVYKLKYLTEPAKTFYTRFGSWDLIFWILFFIGLIYRGKNART